MQISRFSNSRQSFGYLLTPKYVEMSISERGLSNAQTELAAQRKMNKDSAILDYLPGHRYVLIFPKYQHTVYLGFLPSSKNIVGPEGKAIDKILENSISNGTFSEAIASLKKIFLTEKNILIK